MTFSESQLHSHVWLCKYEYESFPSTTNLISSNNNLLGTFLFFETKFCFDAVVETLVLGQALHYLLFSPSFKGYFMQARKEH